MNKIIVEFWDIIHNASFDKLKNILTENVKVYLPNTGEVFLSAQKYIEFNKKYPGRWYAEIKKYTESSEYIITTVFIQNDEKTMSFYVTSYFKLENNKIKEITEYWGNNEEPPAWRKAEKLSERY